MADGRESRWDRRAALDAARRDLERRGVVPGLMRTGSPVNALFKGRRNSSPEHARRIGLGS